MSLSIVTNVPSLVVQNNLSNATRDLNIAIEHMSTGYRINCAAEDAAGYAIATKMEGQLSSVSVAQNNVQLGLSMLSTEESNYELVITHLQRIRDLTEEAANGTCGTDAINAIKEEVKSRWDEIDRIAASTEFNTIKLMSGASPQATSGINLQIGEGPATTSVLNVEAELFKSATVQSLQGTGGVTQATFLGYFTVGGANYSTALTKVDAAITTATTRQTKLGAYQNRLDSAGDALEVQYTNLSASISTIKDADIAQESSEYVQAQILQQASATLLSTANQAPSIALSLI